MPHLRDRARHQQKWAPAGAYKGDLDTFSGYKPLNRENTFPRWDSNCIPALAITGLPRKHAEFCPIRHRYGPVRSPMCVLCTHRKMASSKHRNHQPHPTRFAGDHQQPQQLG